MTSRVTLDAMGDLMLAYQWDALERSDQLQEALRELAKLTESSDLVFANLEVTLAGNEGVIDKQPRLVGEAATVQSGLRALNVDVANLANNHTFDALESGFLNTRTLLEQMGVEYLGAGINSREASRPLEVKTGGMRFCFLAYTDRGTEPSHLASSSQFGVNPLDTEVAIAEVEAWSRRVDHVVVSIHWGVEYSHMPSPDQICFARRVVDSGAHLVIGHHAHVVQGIERHAEGLIAYNLGNCLTTDLQIDDRLAIRQSARSRSAFLLRVDMDRQRILGYEAIPLRTVGKEVRIGDGRAKAYFEAANRILSRGVTRGRWRRRRLYEDVLLRSLRKLHPAVVLSLRGRHFKRFFQNLVRGMMGQSPA